MSASIVIFFVTILYLVAFAVVSQRKSRRQTKRMEV